MKDEIINSFLNLFQLTINTILYELRVYPSIAFQPKKIFGLDVNVAKKGLLDEYLSQLAQQIEGLLKEDVLYMTSIKIKDKEGKDIFIMEQELIKDKNLEDIQEENEESFLLDCYMKSTLDKLQKELLKIDVKREEGEEYYEEGMNMEVSVETNGRELDIELSKYMLIDHFIIKSDISMQQERKEQEKDLKLKQLEFEFMGEYQVSSSIRM